MGPVINFVTDYLIGTRNGRQESPSELRQTGQPHKTPAELKELLANNSLVASVRQIDERIINFVAQFAIPLLRTSLALIYIWFGALKIFGVSPVDDLVAKAALFVPKKTFVQLVGMLEVLVGLGFLLRAALRLTLFLFFFQVAGTFITVFTHPKEAFRKGNPLLLTKNGEFVIKNLVLLAAGLVVASTAQRRNEEIRDRQGRIAN